MKRLFARTVMLLALAVLTFTTAWADDYPSYITDLIVVGGSKDNVAKYKKKYEDLGYTFINKDLNEDAGGDWIYLGYKKSNRASTNGGYITGLYIRSASSNKDWTSSLTHTPDGETHTYYYVPYYGGGNNSDFEKQRGDLNRGAGGPYIWLYYTRENFKDKRVISEIVIDESSTSSVYWTMGKNGGTSAAYDLNDNAGGKYIYLHYKRDYKVNRPAYDPEFYSNLIYTGSAQSLVSYNPTSNSCTMSYCVGSSSGTYVSNPTATNAGTYYVYYHANANSYGNQSGNFYRKVVVGTASNSYSTTPTAKSLTYTGSAQELVNAGKAKFGTIAYKLGTNGTYSSSIPKATDKGTYTVYYKVTGNNNYLGLDEKSITVTIGQASNSFTTKPLGKTLTYTGNSQKLIDKLYANFGTVEYKVNNGSYSTSLPYGTAAGTYTVYYRVVGNSNYTSISGSVTTTIQQASNSFTTKPLGKTLTYTGNSQKLIDKLYANFGTVEYKVNNGSYSTSLPYGTAAGTYTIYYRVVGTSNYTSISGTVTTTINRASNSYTTLPSAKTGLVYTGQAQTLINAGQAKAGTVYYKVGNGTYSTNVPTATNRGTYTLYYKVVGDNNYADIAESSFSVSIAQASNSYKTEPSAKTLTYTGEAQALVNAGTAKFGDVKYKLGSNGTYSSSVPTGTAAGNYVVYCKVEATDNYSGIAEKTIAVTIQKANNSYTTLPSAKTRLVYTGKEQPLVNTGRAKGGTVLYKLGSDGTYSSNVPTATEDGVYTVYYKVDETSNYKAIAERSVSVTIGLPWGETADGSKEHPYIITSTLGLDLLAKKVNAGKTFYGSYFELGANITYNKSITNNYTPIGNYENSFWGYFDGKGYTISGINIQRESGYQALFGSSDKTIQNVTLANSIISSTSSYVGGIVGYAGGDIINCHVTADVTLNGKQNVGGIVGFTGSIIQGCTCAATVSAEKNQAGGIAGFLNRATVKDCLYYGVSVSGYWSGIGLSLVGALVGYAYNNSTIENCYYTVDMSGVGNITKHDGARYSEVTIIKQSVIGNVLRTYGVTAEKPIVTAYENGIGFNGEYYIPVYKLIAGTEGLRFYKGSSIVTKAFVGETVDVVLSNSIAVPEGKYASSLVSDVEGLTIELGSNHLGKFVVPSHDVTVSVGWSDCYPYVFDLTDNTTKNMDANVLQTEALGGLAAYYSFRIDKTGETLPSYEGLFDLKNNMTNGFTVVFDIDLDGTTDAELSVAAPTFSMVRKAGATKLTSNYRQSFRNTKLFNPYNGVVFKFGNDFETQDLEKLLPLINDSHYNETILNLTVSSADGLEEAHPVDLQSVVLKDRTLWCDDDWNTLCLPFTVDLQDKESPLFGATARTLESASLEDDNLRLHFGDPVSVLEAGVPYLIKWTDASVEKIYNPIFRDVLINDDINSFESEDSYVHFRGTYNKMTFENEREDILFLGSNNKLYYPDGTAPTNIGACRAYFKLGADKTAAQVRNIILDFGDDETVTIEDAKVEVDENGDAWFSLDGQKLSGKPTQKGLFINNNKKVLTK